MNCLLLTGLWNTFRWRDLLHIGSFMDGKITCPSFPRIHNPKGHRVLMLVLKEVRNRVMAADIKWDRLSQKTVFSSTAGLDRR